MRVSSVFPRLLFVLAVSVVLSNCTTNTGQAGIPADNAQAEAQSPNSDRHAAAEEQPAGAAALASTNPTEYRISPYDSLQVSVFQVQDLNKTVSVNADGTISLPLVGKFTVAGKTTSQTEELIGERLRKKYLQSPQVSVSVAKFGQRVTVSGSVKGPRVVTVDGQLTLTEAVANAGGLSELANSDRVHIVRKKGQRIHDEVYNFGAIEAGKVQDPMLQGGDLVVAEESGVRVAFKQVKDVLPFAVLGSLF